MERDAENQAQRKNATAAITEPKPSGSQRLRQLRSRMSLRQRFVKPRAGQDQIANMPQPLKNETPSGPQQTVHTDEMSHNCDRPGLTQDYLRTLVCTTTHGQAILQLQRIKADQMLCPMQDKNIDAAICYHRQFPPDETDDELDLVWFQFGRMCRPEEVNHSCLCWTEGAVSLRSLQPVSTPSAQASNTPPASTLVEIPPGTPEPKTAKAAIYAWHSIERMFQIYIQVRFPLGAAITYQTVMYYDTGSSTLTINETESQQLGIRDHNCYPARAKTAVGWEYLKRVPVESRIMTEKGAVFIPWNVVDALIVPGTTTHLSNRLLQQHAYVCSTPKPMLYAAKGWLSLFATVL